ncbi:hypothetical protein J0H58_22495 [bacterium]|nr:hypothetical protein [bacterium]
MTKSLSSLKVVSYTKRHVPNDYPDGDLPWQVYHTVRNALVHTCRRFGPVGPMGAAKIVPGFESAYHAFVADPSVWEPGDSDPMYFILDDQLNHERYCYAELYGDNPFSADWLFAVSETLREFDGWGLGVSNIPYSYVIVFGTRILVSGRLAGCRSAAEVITTAGRLLKRRNRKWWQFWK